jgi:hypothetical protein
VGLSGTQNQKAEVVSHIGGKFSGKIFLREGFLKLYQEIHTKLSKYIE